MLQIKVNFHFEYDQSASILLTHRIGVRVFAMGCTNWRGKRKRTKIYRL